MTGFLLPPASRGSPREGRGGEGGVRPGFRPRVVPGKVSSELISGLAVRGRVHRFL